jgi:hypothetical protein
MVFGVSTFFVGIAESDRTLSSKQLIRGSSAAFRFLQLQLFFCFKVFNFCQNRAVLLWLRTISVREH